MLHYHALEKYPSFVQQLTYLDESGIAKIEKALLFATQAHEGQMRLSGEPYITHPVAVAEILAELKMDYRCISAGLLHDVIEDTDYDYVDIEKQFDKEIAGMVEGLTKIERMPAKSRRENQAENFLKMIMAMCNDIRVLLIKLADRLHNMRTLFHAGEEQKKRIARETLDIYAPLARRLGMNEIAAELEEIGFKTSYPLRYATLRRATMSIEKKHRMTLEKITHKIEAALNTQDIPYAYICSRKKHLYSLYQKMRRKKLSFNEITDIYAIRACVRYAKDCYTVLGLIHGLYRPMPHKFKDYIAIPKSNGYQSLHTILFGPSGGIIEAQIRSVEMDQFANMGIAAHYLYKSNDKKNSKRHQQAQQWLNKLMVMQKKMTNSLEFIEHLKIDLCPDKVYVFTPEGDIIELPSGATVLDFAYAIHTSVGDHCVLAKINQQICPLSTVLKHGQTVSVVTKEDASPDQSWLHFVVTNKAKNAIRHYFRDQRREDLIQLGWRIVNKACLVQGIELPKLDHKILESAAMQYAGYSLDEVLEQIALGQGAAVAFVKVLSGLVEWDSGSVEDRQEEKITPLVITGHENLAMNYGSCCCPIPGDAIVGMVVPGEGVFVHRRQCTKLGDLAHQDGCYAIDVEWGDAIRHGFSAQLDLYTLNQKGTLAVITGAVAQDGVNITDMRIASRDENTAIVHLILHINDRYQLSRIVRRLRRERCILRIKRVIGDEDDK